MKITKMLSAGLMLLCAGATVHGAGTDSSGSTVTKSLLPYHTPYTVRAAGYGLSTLAFGAGAISDGITIKRDIKLLKQKLKELDNCLPGDNATKQVLNTEIKNLRKKLLINILVCGASGLMSFGSFFMTEGFAGKASRVAKVEKNQNRSGWRHRQKQSRLSQIFSTAPFEKTSGSLSDEGELSNFDQDIVSGKAQATPYASHRKQRVHVQLGSPEAPVLNAGHLPQGQRTTYTSIPQLLGARFSSGLTALGIEGAERSGIMQKVSGEVLSMSAAQAEEHIDSVLQQLAEAKSITNLDELIEAEVEKRKAAAAPYSL